MASRELYARCHLVQRNVLSQAAHLIVTSSMETWRREPPATYLLQASGSRKITDKLHGQQRGRGFRVKSALRRPADALIIDHTTQLPAPRLPVVPDFADAQAHVMFKTCGLQKKVLL